MRPILFALSALALVGCANVDQLRAQARYQPDYAVCEKMTVGIGPIRGVAAEEAQRRNLDCTPHQGAILANQQQQTQTSLQLLQMSRPQPQPMPALIQPSVTCRSVRNGNVTNTTCD